MRDPFTSRSPATYPLRLFSVIESLPPRPYDPWGKEVWLVCSYISGAEQALPQCKQLTFSLSEVWPCPSLLCGSDSVPKWGYYRAYLFLSRWSHCLVCFDHRNLLPALIPYYIAPVCYPSSSRDWISFLWTFDSLDCIKHLQLGFPSSDGS